MRLAVLKWRVIKVIKRLNVECSVCTHPSTLRYLHGCGRFNKHNTTPTPNNYLLKSTSRNFLVCKQLVIRLPWWQNDNVYFHASLINQKSQAIVNGVNVPSKTFRLGASDNCYLITGYYSLWSMDHCWQLAVSRI